MKKIIVSLLSLLLLLNSCKVPYNIRSLRNGYNKLRPATWSVEDRKLATTSILNKRYDFKFANFWFERSYSAELVVLAGDSIRYSMNGLTDDKWVHLRSSLVVSDYSIECNQDKEGRFGFYIPSIELTGKNLIKSLFGNTQVYTLLKGNDTIFSKPITAYQPIDILSPQIIGYDKRLSPGDVIKWNRDTLNHDGIVVGVTCYRGDEIIESFKYITEDWGSLMMYNIYRKLPPTTRSIYLTLSRTKLVFIDGKDKKTYKISIESQVSTGYDL
jgi:hypothetical protein